MSNIPTADVPVASELSRRRALQLLAANLALAASGCSKPAEEIVPYVAMPERLVPGEPLRFATTLPLAGYGRGVICRSLEGRPIKVDGNPQHPASLGSTDVFAEAAVFSLYDPDRSRAVRRDGVISSWQAFATALQKRLGAHRSDAEGLRLLTGRLTSPTLLRQLAELRVRFPGLVHHAYDPTDDPNAERGAVLAFGRPLRALPRWQDVDVLVTLDADPLGPGPAQIRNARGYAERRRVRAGTTAMLRHYAFEAVPSLSGASADHRIALAPDAVAAAAVVLARALGADLPQATLPADAQQIAAAAAADLAARPRGALVLAGPAQPPEIHALVHWINSKLGAPIDYLPPLDAPAAATLPELVQDLAAGRVSTLLICDVNPVYDAPADLAFEQALRKAEFTAHLGAYWDETGRQCQWHLPQSHPLETWSDLRAVEGTASIAQPLIRPLYDTRDLHAVLARLAGRQDAGAYELVRETWRGQQDAEAFERTWRQTLNDGVVAGSAASAVAVPQPQLPTLPAIAEPRGFALLLQPDPSVWDGSFANNAWLQECPKPLGKEVWGNSLGMAPSDANALGLRDGDVVRLTVGNQLLEAPVRAAPGQAKGVLSLTLGYGRTAAGAIGNRIGSNTYFLRQQETPWRLDGVALATTGARQPIASTQHQFRLDGDERALFPETTLAHLGEGIAPPEEPASRPSFYRPPLEPGAYRWGMVIDTTACIGCNACVVACQAENNVPVVGPREVLRERDMHWLRIDAYNTGTDAAPRFGFQPVPCMHCEEAPCEPVCPVAASVHDEEGLNVQVYNRCVGTRFCQANCPYKVRRFNFHGYADGQPYANLGAEIMRAHYNPDVSVRARGVMEKCTYCVQRISGARRTAEKEGRAIRDGEVTPACQDACPTRAITFGNLADAGSAARGLRQEPHHYALLAHLGTRPKTTYLARVRNQNPALKEVKP